ncbi:phosphoribosyltransferase [Pedobacter sp. NJ-S-72]
MMNTIEVGDRKFGISITNERINERTKLIAAQINADYKDKRPIFIGVLNGSFLFMADLLKETEIPCEVAFMKVSSYKGGLTSTGELKEIFGLPENLKGRHLVLVEDIVDTGLTLKYILEKKVIYRNLLLFAFAAFFLNLKRYFHQLKSWNM